MRQINLESWPRREHFKLYTGFDHPHFGMCANVDLTKFYPAIKQRGISFSIATVYFIARAANGIPEFRQRIRLGSVVEHETVDPSTTIITKDDLFSFCTFHYSESFSIFANEAAEQIAYVKEHLTLNDLPGRDDLLFMTSIPWVTFTSFMHPMHLNPADSIPRFAWGKLFEEGKNLKMPLSVQGHHALMDGIHIGRFYEEIQGHLNQPEDALGEV